MIDDKSDSKKLMVVKHNNLIAASYKLSLDSKRLLLTCIGQLDSRGFKPTNKDRFKVTAKEFSERFGVDKKNVYEQLKTAADGLFDSQIIIRSKTSNRYMRLRWVEEAEYEEDEGFVALSFTKRVLPYLTQLGGNFTKYNLANVSSMTSSHAIRLYEIIIKQLGLDRSTNKAANGGSVKIEIEEFKDLMGCKDNYPRINTFQAKVTKIAVAQINKHSDLAIEVENVLCDKNRSIRALKFTYREKNPSHKKSSEFSTSQKLLEISSTIQVESKPISKTRSEKMRKPSFRL